MKWILIAMQAFVMMFCFVYGTNAKAEVPVPEVNRERPSSYNFIRANVC